MSSRDNTIFMLMDTITQACTCSLYLTPSGSIHVFHLLHDKAVGYEIDVNKMSSLPIPTPPHPL